MTTTQMKAGDLEPDLVADLVASPSTTNLNLVSSWRIIGRLMGETALVVDAVPTVDVDDLNTYRAVATHQWTGTQTATAGLLLLELEATWPSGAKQTFPTEDYIRVRINEDLG